MTEASSQARKIPVPTAVEQDKRLATLRCCGPSWAADRIEQLTHREGVYERFVIEARRRLDPEDAEWMTAALRDELEKVTRGDD